MKTNKTNKTNKKNKNWTSLQYAGFFIFKMIKIKCRQFIYLKNEIKPILINRIHIFPFMTFIFSCRMPR
ncbi:MAG TPA: hypothetical protein DIT05_11035 [Morganella sp. (in: Bacteria)]|nr:hypothetical protein [Morganella sp. (in: enterobacteria)]